MEVKEVKEIIDKINLSNSVIDIFPNYKDWKSIYREYSMLIHPDRCNEIGCNDAFVKLSKYAEELEKGKKLKDEAGVVSYSTSYLEIIGDSVLLQTSCINYTKLKNLNGDSNKHFQQYIPSESTSLSSNELRFNISKRAIPLSTLVPLKQEYVNFILSRMLEFTQWMNQIGYCHAGINPDSIWVVPEDHGIQCVSFYFMKELDTRVNAISAKYSQLYPSHVFTNKVATQDIDIELSKRTAIYLLGDKSGTVNSLRKTHNNDFLDFIQKKHYDSLDCYREYRDMLRANFDTKQFHILNV